MSLTLKDKNEISPTLPNPGKGDNIYAHAKDQEVSANAYLRYDAYRIFERTKLGTEFLARAPKRGGLAPVKTNIYQGDGNVTRFEYLTWNKKETYDRVVKITEKELAEIGPENLRFRFDISLSSIDEGKIKQIESLAHEVFIHAEPKLNRIEKWRQDAASGRKTNKELHTELKEISIMHDFYALNGHNSMYGGLDHAQWLLGQRPKHTQFIHEVLDSFSSKYERNLLRKEYNEMIQNYSPENDDDVKFYFKHGVGKYSRRKSLTTQIKAMELEP